MHKNFPTERRISRIMSCKWLIVVCWIIGLVLGIASSAGADNSFFLLMRRVSFRWNICGETLKQQNSPKNHNPSPLMMHIRFIWINGIPYTAFAATRSKTQKCSMHISNSMASLVRAGLSLRTKCILAPGS